MLHAFRLQCISFFILSRQIVRQDFTLIFNKVNYVKLFHVMEVNGRGGNVWEITVQVVEFFAVV
jgi:hypothetical protein